MEDVKYIFSGFTQFYMSREVLKIKEKKEEKFSFG